MDPVHDTIYIGTHIRRAVSQKTADEKKFFCVGGHRYMIMRSIPMMKKGLQKIGSIPVYSKKDRYKHVSFLSN
jgi:hypothetical protein